MVREALPPTCGPPPAAAAAAAVGLGALPAATGGVTGTRIDLGEKEGGRSGEKRQGEGRGKGEGEVSGWGVLDAKL